MKKFSLILMMVCMGLIGFSSTAWAVKPTETLIAHCGCNFDGDAMEWQIITVNPKSRGHQNHEVDDTEECRDPDGLNPVFLDRDFDDCELLGQLPGLEACAEVYQQDDSCGDSV